MAPDDIPAVRDPDRCPTHPGELLAEALGATATSKTAVAKLLGISRPTLYDIMNGKQPITPAVAVRIGKLLGNGPGIWLRMQVAHDAWHAERKIDVSGIPTLTAA